MMNQLVASPLVNTHRQSKPHIWINFTSNCSTKQKIDVFSVDICSHVVDMSEMFKFFLIIDRKISHHNNSRSFQQLFMAMCSIRKAQYTSITLGIPDMIMGVRWGDYVWRIEFPMFMCKKQFSASLLCFFCGFSNWRTSLMCIDYESMGTPPPTWKQGTQTENT